MESNRKQLIFIAVTNTGTVRAELLPALIAYARHPKYDVRFYFPNIVPLDASRNTCVEQFMKLSNHPDDRILWIDDDMGAPNNALDILMSHDKDICGLLCPMVKPNDLGYLVPLPVACRYNENKQYVVHMGDSGLVEVDAVGGAFLMVKRKVYEEIGTRAYQYQYYPNGALSLVADYYFCQLAQAKGFKIFIDFDYMCNHYKEIDLKEFNNTMVAYGK